MTQTIPRVADMPPEQQQWMREIFSRRTSKFTATHAAELEFHGELYSSAGMSFTIFCTDETTEDQRQAAEHDLRGRDDVATVDFLIVPKEWIDEDVFKPGERISWLDAAKRVAREGYLRVHRLTNEVIPETKSGGVLLDSFTASMLVQVDAAVLESVKKRIDQGDVSGAAKLLAGLAKWRTMPLTAAVQRGWKLVRG